MKSLKPHLEILPQSQKDLWLRLSETPKQFILYGGTALALRLGHRESIDFDFFSPQNIDTEHLLRTTPYLSQARIVDEQENSLTCIVDGVQLSYFGLKKWHVIQPPEIAEGAEIKIASILDIAGTKLKVIQQRPSWKDYVDLHAILTQSPLTLEEALAAGMRIYEQFNPLSALRALRYFDDIKDNQLTDNHKQDLVKFIELVNLDFVEKHFETYKKG